MPSNSPLPTCTFQVSIINRSYAKNTYRVVDIPAEYGNVLQVAYKLPGYLATGVAGELVITFTPKVRCEGHGPSRWGWWGWGCDVPWGLDIVGMWHEMCA